MIRIKGFLVVLIGLFIMISLVAMLIPSKVVTVRGMPVHASKEKIVANIADLKKWKLWHPVFRADSAVTYSEPSTGVNASIDWTTSSKVNKIKIIEATDAGIKFLLIRPGENDVENILSVAPLQDSTGFQVEWQALTKLKWYPWEKFGGIFVDKMTGPGYEVALENLRKYTEENR